jgi:hypothetical protein
VAMLLLRENETIAGQKPSSAPAGRHVVGPHSERQRAAERCHGRPSSGHWNRDVRYVSLLSLAFKNGPYSLLAIHPLTGIRGRLPILVAISAAERRDSVPYLEEM